MRLHHLEITAFGPFPDTVTVDFDALSEAGIFLLCGATGAGKTSVLDAVCFALYGDVPGDRSNARRLRCDVAPAGRAPRVRLDLTLAGRRFRLTRSPQWTRPKKRGSGITTEQAAVLVEERVDGEWIALSTRLDEAGHLIGGLVGMTMPQFCQVALLPQGRFQAFLRATSDERHKLLQQLFSTQRFEDVEKWLRERSRILHRDSQKHLQIVAGVTSRFAEAAAVELPEELADLAEGADTGALAGFAAVVTGEATATADVAEAHRLAAAESEDLSRAAVDEGRRVSALIRRATLASAEVSRLEADGPTQAVRRAALGAARRAAPVPPLRRLARGARDRHAQAADRARVALAEADAAVGLTDLDLAALESALTESREACAAAESLVPRAADHARLLDTIACGEAETRRLRASCQALAATASGLPATLDDLRRRVAVGREARVQLEGQAERERELVARVGAHHRATALSGELAATSTELGAVLTQCHSLKETWLDLREARINGMAAELASSLVVGACCPVCGSADHPHKADRQPDAPDADSEKAARSRLDDAELVRTALESKLHDLRGRHSRAAVEAGAAPADEVARDLAALRELIARLTAQVAPLADDEAALAATEEQATRVQVERIATEAELAAAVARLEADQAAGEALDREVTAALASAGAESVDALVARSRTRVSLLERAVSTSRAAEAAAAEATHAEAALAACLAECGFASADEAESHVLAPDALSRLEADLASYDDALAAARAVLADPDVTAVLGSPEPDLAELSAVHEQARARLADCQVAARRATDRALRLTVLARELDRCLSAWQPVREGHALVAEMAAFVEGKSPDNELRMRLSAYVLAWRLTQVVAAANERLVRMSDQRYALEHTGRRGAGETRGGLSLLVRDAWSGEARDPATLSGGETFVVSLALALGLADVVGHEAGGTDLDTLFVDEGFGALDPDTLDDVMDTLDTLREGGRVVGVVSHVAELRTRLTTRLVVAKDRSGSTLTLERGDLG